jgi:1-deoxy-D-xylulose-5-phosphate synthase
MTSLLETLDLPRDLRTLDKEGLCQVVDELRSDLIASIAKSGGHFASSLGVAEITVALHHLFDTPNDKLVWDTGHQCYIHKMVTGRRGDLRTIRQKGGLSGFLKREESPYDTFGAGHAGTSVSAAVGMRLSLDRLDPDKYVVAIIGDGSLTSGMVFEALNNAGHLKCKRLIVLLNDNEMSISPNVGALSWFFSRAKTSPFSTKARRWFKEFYRKGYVPQLLYKTVDRAEEAWAAFFSSPAKLFEAFGFRYIGPVDGHDIGALLIALENGKQQDGPVLIHAITKKGRGFTEAEVDPVKWHAVKPFLLKVCGTNDRDLTTTPPSSRLTYTEVFSQSLLALIKSDRRIMAITAAMAEGTGLDRIRDECPKNFLDVGICEQHAVTCAAGMATLGSLPVCAIYSTFLQRGLDQVIHDVAIQRLGVLFAMDRAGLVGNDGETHQGVFDISLLRSIPHMVLMAPFDERELALMVKTSIDLISQGMPVALRYPRGFGAGVPLIDFSELVNIPSLPLGVAEVVERGVDNELLFICYGSLRECVFTAKRLIFEHVGISGTIINARFCKPLDCDLLLSEIKQHRIVCTIEDGSIQGGFGSSILEALNDAGLSSQFPILRFGVGDHFVSHASQSEQVRDEGLNGEAIAESVLPLLMSVSRKQVAQ